MKQLILFLILLYSVNVHGQQRRWFGDVDSSKMAEYDSINKQVALIRKADEFLKDYNNYFYYSDTINALLSLDSAVYYGHSKVYYWYEATKKSLEIGDTIKAYKFYKVCKEMNPDWVKEFTMKLIEGYPNKIKLAFDKFK